MDYTKKLIAKWPGTHRPGEFAVDFPKRQGIIDVIEGAAFETKIKNQPMK